MEVRLRGRRRLLAIPIAMVTLFAIAIPSQATLVAGALNAADGNLVVNAGVKDWANVGIDCTSTPKVGCGLDQPTGQQDDSFGQGTKEDTAVPSVIDGSIPNNKSDLTRLYVANERIGASEFLYLAWERVQEPSGTTNMDFEFNQSRTVSANGVTPVRTAGDVLIKYDLAQGGVNPVLGFHRWVTLASAAGQTPPQACEASNTFPCWGKVNPIVAPNFEASINAAGPVTDPIAPGAPRSLSIRTFGEAAINLTGSGILPANACEGFGRAYLKSRSSDSFTAAVKDFIAPIPVNIANCGTITIKKETVPDEDPNATDFSFTHNVGTNSSPQVTSPFTLKDDGAQLFDKVQSGNYTVTETVPAGWDLTDLQCTKDGAAYDAAETAPTASIAIAAGDDVVCTFTNTARATLIVEKQTNPDGATGNFTFTGTAAGTISDGGQIRVENLAPGQYASTEADPTPAFDLRSIVCDDANSSGNVATRTATFNLEAGETVTCVFTNRQRGRIDVLKLDDDSPANPLNGAVFTLYNDAAPVGGTRGAEDTSTGITCTTSGSGADAGKCSFTDVVPGNYWVVETTTPGGHETAPDQQAVVGAGGTVSLTFVDERFFKVIVLVCEKAGNTLYPSKVSFDGDALPGTANSPSSVPAAIDETALCQLSGTYVHDDVNKGNHSANVNIPQ